MKRLLLLMIALIMFVFNVSASDKTAVADKSIASMDTVNAVWQEHEKKFTVFSPYNYYSCDGMENTVETLLEELGAKDIKARATGCFDANARLGKNLRVKVKFKTLSASTDSQSEVDSVTASLQNVHIRPRHPRTIDNGDCEIVESIQDKLLEFFEHEVIKENRKCFPGQQSLGDVDWELKVLRETS